MLFATCSHRARALKWADFQAGLPVRGAHLPLTQAMSIREAGPRQTKAQPRRRTKDMSTPAPGTRAGEPIPAPGPTRPRTQVAVAGIPAAAILVPIPAMGDVTTA